ncbi:hypothetical protein FOZ63_025460 [Perkinsus olseni]|uniref:LITAF domain-containing protein n=1 Tax=Perkinsus olseni TaxID=32597 RepID=A0A7J6QHD0_PEROL|nr:hypothetical protein FOZ63_025460 [Perkinsus olseni]
MNRNLQSLIQIGNFLLSLPLISRVRQRYQIAGGVLVPAANNNTVASGNVTVISGGEATLDRIASGGGALTLPTSRPIAMVCPVCKCTVVTRVHYRSGACTLFAAAGLCCTFPLFFWIPFCCSDLKDVIHVCPNCRSPIGMRSRSLMCNSIALLRPDTIEDAVEFLYLPLKGAGLGAGDVAIRAYGGGVVILRSPKQENLVKLRIIEVVSKWSIPVSWRQWLVEVGRPHTVQFTVEKEEASTTTSHRRKGEIPDDATGRCLLMSCSTIQEVDVVSSRGAAGGGIPIRQGIRIKQPVLLLDHRRGQWEKRLIKVRVGLLSVYDYRSDGTLSEGELVKRMPLTMNLTIRSLSDLGNWLLPLTAGGTPPNAEDLREAGTPFTRGLLGGLPGNGGDVWEVGLELCSIDDDHRADHTVDSELRRGTGCEEMILALLAVLDIVLMPRSCEERDTLVSALRLAMTTEPPTFDGPSSTETDSRACKGGLSGKVQRLSKEVEELRAELMLARKLASTGGVDLASRALVSSSLMPVVEEDEDTLLKASGIFGEAASEGAVDSVTLNFRVTNPANQGFQTLQMAIQEGASRVVDSIKTTLSPGQEFAALRDDEEQLGGYAQFEEQW